MIYLEVKLPDIPGSLIELIRPVSQHGGNIYGVLHHHDKKINNMIPVDIWFELSEELIQISLKNIKDVENLSTLLVFSFGRITKKLWEVFLLSL